MNNSDPHRRRRFDAGEMLREVRDMVRRETRLEPGHGMVVAVSGGVDSMVLLDLLYRLQGELRMGLHVAHLDHQLRIESAADGEFVAHSARERGLPYTVESRDVADCARANGWSLEDAGRRLRYQFFEQVAVASGSVLIALGHHADDQAETVLWRLLRGSGTTGLSAMEPVRQDRYIRPLLTFERAAIERYATESKVGFRQDESNADTRFVRNRVRAGLIPYLKRSYNPNIIQVLNRTANVLREEDRLLEELAQTALEAVVCARSVGKFVLDAGLILDYHIALQRRVAKLVLQGLSACEGPFDFAHVEALLQIWRQPDSGLRQLAGDIWAQRAGGRILLRRGRSKAVAGLLRVPGQTFIPERQLVLNCRLLAGENPDQVKASLGGQKAAFDADSFSGELAFRSLRPGDRFRPLGMGGHEKKLSDFLVDSKVPRISRDEILLVTCNKEIVWVVGMRPSHAFRLRSDSSSLLLIDCTTESGFD
ncbi:MAG: tRNA lysidine(34) synthetase TilS [Candidatus Latescibacteria bacterium]|nr:tRNA lysidine(34) synthetase TilS [Candidatus Latescibacterota bacterium]